MSLPFYHFQRPATYLATSTYLIASVQNLVCHFNITDPESNHNLVTDNLPSTSSATPNTLVPVDSDLILEDSVLMLLGDAPKLTQKFGPRIHKDVASRWQELLTKGMSKDKRDKLIEQYLIPENCDMLVPVTLNPEVKVAVSDVVVKRDNALLEKQNQTSAVLSALAQGMELILKNGANPQILKTISDASRLLCDAQYRDHQTRKNYIISATNSDLKDTLLDSTRTSYMFGDNVAEKLRAAKAVQRSGSDLKQKFRKNNFYLKTNPNIANKNLNWRTLHRRPGSKPNAGPYHRRAPAPPPPPPPSRSYGAPPRRDRSPPPPPPQRTTYRRPYRR